MVNLNKPERRETYTNPAVVLIRERELIRIGLVVKTVYDSTFKHYTLHISLKEFHNEKKPSRRNKDDKS